METKLPLNFILSFCKEILPGHGEDCYCYTFCDTVGLLGVFDGCGGAGARKHEHYSGQTEAYVASRLVSGVFYDQFRRCYPSDMEATRFVGEVLAPAVNECLKTYQPPKEDSDFQIRGSMVRTLPTTAAAALVRQLDDSKMQVDAIWAGDSRVYILDEWGLAQLTVDDTSVPDPMENLYEDGVLRNILCTEKAAKLRMNSVTVSQPALVLAATDGCFGYVSTPMEFEGMLLDTLMVSENVAQWEEQLAQVIGQFAGDDHTLCLGAFGYQDFTEMKRAFSRRYQSLCAQCLDTISQLPLEDRQTRTELWNLYQDNYCRFLKDGQS
ncbi:MAG: protein phosphatase 2C domain-containing protein [Oscillospiraceae bacterium]|nr:protein phosphatase 2C domain-containing protein [Oscillospiraceae bacterium]